MAIRQRIAEAVENVRSSYWFLPTLLAFTGLALGLGLVLIDARMGNSWLGRYEWFYGSRPEGARAMLSTIAGSTITVAGVVFSITLAAVTYASGQFGPRLLGNFVRDRGNQATLGIFIGTYLYCLIVLRTIRSAGETTTDAAGSLQDSFVPYVAMFGGLALAIASTAVLIYFVHHVTSGIHINNVIARVGRDLIADIERVERAEQRASAPTAKSVGPFVSIPSAKTGYIETIDMEALLRIAGRHDLVLRPIRRAGDFVVDGWPLLEAGGSAQLTEQTKVACRDVITIGRRRTAQEDLRFAMDELVEIASRALSPGVNDPFTAMACIDWLGAALTKLDRLPAPPDCLTDEKGLVRLLVSPLRFEDYLISAFGRLRTYVAADPNARVHALSTLQQLSERASGAGHAALIDAEQARLSALCADG